MTKRKRQRILNAAIAISVFAVTVGLFPAARAGEFAPKDAYLDGSLHPYYGSAGKWGHSFSKKPNPRQPKRQGQHAMFNIVEGRYDQVAQYCQELLAANQNDSEVLYNLTIAQIQLKDIDAAVRSMKRALDAGLPFARFLAGPRELLEPLTETSQFKEYAARHNVQLIHGPMIGCLTDRAAKFWVRTLDETPVQVLVSNAKDLAYPAKSSVTSTSSKNDYTAVVELKDLKPATRYYYDVLLDGKSVTAPEYPSFTTYPAENSKARFEVGFGGGAGYTPANERIWDTIASHKPSAFLFLGDNVYIDLPQQYGDFHRYTYYRRQSQPQFRQLIASTSIYAIWDDHDCAMNDAWMGPYRDKPTWKMSMIEGFRQNWNNPGYGDENWPGCWFKFSIAELFAILRLGSIPSGPFLFLALSIIAPIPPKIPLPIPEPAGPKKAPPNPPKIPPIPETLPIIYSS